MADHQRYLRVAGGQVGECAHVRRGRGRGAVDDHGKSGVVVGRAEHRFDEGRPVRGRGEFSDAVQPAAGHVALHLGRDLGVGATEGDGAETEEAVGVCGESLVQLPQRQGESVIPGTAGQRPFQRAHFVVEGVEIGGPFRVCAGGEQHRTVHSRGVERRQMGVERVVDMAVGVENHVSP